MLKSRVLPFVMGCDSEDTIKTVVHHVTHLMPHCCSFHCCKQALHNSVDLIRDAEGKLTEAQKAFSDASSEAEMLKYRRQMLLETYQQHVVDCLAPLSGGLGFSNEIIFNKGDCFPEGYQEINREQLLGTIDNLMSKEGSAAQAMVHCRKQSINTILASKRKYVEERQALMKSILNHQEMLLLAHDRYNVRVI